jgi:hypothetical protein
MPARVVQGAAGRIGRYVEPLFLNRSGHTAHRFQTPLIGAIATIQLARHILHTTAPTRYGPTFTSVREFRRQLHDQRRMFALHAAFAASAEEPARTQLELRLRAADQAGPARPGMQFAQPVSTGGQELLTAIRNIESTLEKVQSVPALSAPQAPDMQRITAHVFDQLERQLRIDRERRGRN